MRLRRRCWISAEQAWNKNGGIVRVNFYPVSYASNLNLIHAADIWLVGEKDGKK